MAHLLLLICLLSLAEILQQSRLQAFFLTLAIAPLIRIVSLGMPLGTLPQVWWYVLTAVPLFLAGGLIARQLGLSRQSLALQLPRPGHIPLELAMVVTSPLLGLVEWRILQPSPIIPAGSSVSMLILGALVLLLFTGLLEEFLFRGLLQGVAIRLLGPNMGWIFAAMLFAALHIGWRSLPDVAFAFGVGLYFGLVVKITRSLTAVTIAHGAINTMLFVVLPFSLH